jgi:diguanylate cyclase (GGDEF)-like protein/putative nucleotidyltransferase with HDIG domain
LAKRVLPSLSKLALEATHETPAAEVLVRAMELVRGQTAAISALLFYGDEGRFDGAGVGDSPERYPAAALTYVQQRLVQLRVPLAFNLGDGEVRFLTRAANKQRRDYVAWRVPAADSWTEMLILRGSWPPDAIPPLLEFVDSAMPALTIMLERFVGVGRRQRLERQLTTISSSVDVLKNVAEVVGSVAAVYPTTNGIAEDQVALLRKLAADATETLDEVRRNRDLMESHLRLQEYNARLERAVLAERQQASTDALTGLLNHRGALRALEVAFTAAAENKGQLSLLMGDVDGFKLFNDTYGHITGDEVLKLVAGTARAVAQDVGTICRYGGDEFLIILPGFDKAAATVIASEMMHRLGEAEFRSDENQLVPIRMSIGAATFPDDSDSLSKLVALADAAMYAAKQRGAGANPSAAASSTDTTFGVLDSLVQAIDAKDSYTKVHCDIVAEYAVKLAIRLQLSVESQRALRIAGLLHDVGKLAVPDEILKKPAPLNQHEYEIMQRHVAIGEVLIREVPELEEVIQAVACHHERFDGTGYPRGLKGDAIPLIGRIIAIADAYSAMCLDRPYRKGMSHDRVLNELVAGAGVQFDPGITQTFVELLLEEQLVQHRRNGDRLVA